MTALSFVVHGPPVPKARARVVATPGGRARAFTPKRTASYEAHVGTLALAAKGRRPWPLDALYAVVVDVHRKGGRGDADNYAKAVLDGCNGVLWKDDGQVRDLHVRVYSGGAVEAVNVLVSVIPPPSA